MRYPISIHNAVTWYMVGVIWLVQLVHYPMLEYLDRATFARSHAFHTAMMGWVVGPPMLIELALAAFLLWKRGTLGAFSGFVLVVAAWALTLLVMVPLHERLASQGFTPEVHQLLVRWNWCRTLAWTARGAIAALWL